MVLQTSSCVLLNSFTLDGSLRCIVVEPFLLFLLSSDWSSPDTQRLLLILPLPCLACASHRLTACTCGWMQTRLFFLKKQKTGVLLKWGRGGTQNTRGLNIPTQPHVKSPQFVQNRKTINFHQSECTLTIMSAVKD